MARGLRATIAEIRSSLWQAWEELNKESEGKTKRWFSEGYRICDALLLVTLFAIGSLVYYYLVHSSRPFTTDLWPVIAVAVLCGLALLRVGIAFLLIGLPFLVYGFYKLFLAHFFVEGWTFATGMKHAFEAGICFALGALFIHNCGGDRFIDWLARRLLQTRD